MGMINQLLEQRLFWISVTFSALLLGIVDAVTPEIWSGSQQLVQDDARQFVVWLRQAANPALFPDDLIEQHFSSLTPQLYKLLFAPADLFGIDAVTWHLYFVAPLTSLLFVISAFALFSLFVEKMVFRGFSTLLICLALSAIFVVGLPRSFAFPILFFALTAFLNNKAIWLFVVMLLGGAMYPAAVVVAGMTMLVVVLISTSERTLFHSQNIRLLMSGGVAALGGIALFLSGLSDLGSTISIEEARTLPIFSEGARSDFFRESFFQQVICSGRGGLLPFCFSGQPLLSLIVTGILVGLGIVAYLFLSKDSDPVFRKNFNKLFIALPVAGGILFALSYSVAFQAHLPSRYATMTITLMIIISFIFVLIAASHFVRSGLGSRLSGSLFLLLQISIICLLFYGLVKNAADTMDIEKDEERALSDYLRSTPVDSVVASVGDYADSIPAFTNRTVYFSLEYLVPYKRDYYYVMAERAENLGKILKAADQRKLATMIDETGIDYIVLPDDLSGIAKEWRVTFSAAFDFSADTDLLLRDHGYKDCVVYKGTAASVIDTECIKRHSPQ